MKKLLLLITLLPLFTFCSRDNITEGTLSMTSANTEESCDTCPVKISFQTNQNINIKGLISPGSATVVPPQSASFKVLKDNDTFVFDRFIQMGGSPGDVHPAISGGGVDGLYRVYSVETREVHGGKTYVIQANFRQIGPMYRNVIVESNTPQYGEVAGGGKANIGEDHTISASLKNNSPYGFSHWTKSGVEVEGAGLDYTFKLDLNKDYNAGDTTSIRYMAHFSRDATARTVFEWTEGGEVTGWQHMGLHIPVGTRFTLTAEPESGYKFDRWVKSTHSTGPVTVGREPVYSGRITSRDGATYTAVFESTAQITSMTFNNHVDDFYYTTSTYLTYIDPDGRQQTLHPTTISSYFDIKRGTPVTLYVDIRKNDDYINCFISGSDGQYIDLSGYNEIITTQELIIEPELDNTAVITLQAGE